MKGFSSHQRSHLSTRQWNSCLLHFTDAVNLIPGSSGGCEGTSAGRDAEKWVMEECVGGWRQSCSNLQRLFSRWYLGYPVLDASLCFNDVSLLSLVMKWQTTGLPPRLAGVQRLYEFIKKSPNAVMLLRGACYGFVAHWAHTAHLQPFYKAFSVESMLAW